MKSNETKTDIHLTATQHNKIATDIKKCISAYKLLMILSIISAFIVFIACILNNNEENNEYLIAIIIVTAFFIACISGYLSYLRVLNKIKNKKYKVIQDKVVKKIVRGSGSSYQDSNPYQEHYSYYCKIKSYRYAIQFARDKDFDKVDIGDEIIVIDAGILYRRAYVF